MRGIIVGAGLLAALALATGCGGGDDTSPPPVPPPATSSGPSGAPAPPASPTPPSNADRKQLTKLAACMKRYGVDIPSDPSATFSPPPGYDQAKARKALQKCLPATTP